MRVYVTGKWSNDIFIREVVDVIRNGMRDTEIYCFLEQGRASSEEDLSNRQDALIFHRDLQAIRECDVLVLVGPAGRGSYIEAGYAAGLNKFVAYYKLLSDFRPELLYGLFDVCDNTGTLLGRLRDYKRELIYGTR